MQQIIAQPLRKFHHDNIFLQIPAENSKIRQICKKMKLIQQLF